MREVRAGAEEDATESCTTKGVLVKKGRAVADPPFALKIVHTIGPMEHVAQKGHYFEDFRHLLITA